MIPFDAISKLDPDACLLILKSIAGQSSTGLAVLDTELKYVWVNPAFAEYSGVLLDEHIGKTVSEVLGESAWSDRKALLEAAMSGSVIVEQALTKPLKSINTARSSIRTSYFPLLSASRSIGVLVQVVDYSPFIEAETKLLQEAIVERKTHEKQLQEQEERLNLALRSGRLGTWQLSLQREELIDASPTCRASFGFNADEHFTYSHIVKTIHPDDLQRVLNAVKESRETGCAYQVEYRCIWKDGSQHWIDATAQPTFDEDGKPATLIGISQDVSQRKAAEREKSELLAKIRDFASMQATFFRDVLASVTDGKLRLCQTHSDLPERGVPLNGSIRLTATTGLKDLRSEAKSAAINLGFSSDRWQDLITAASEAGMNSVVHAGGGTSRLFVVRDNCVQIWVSDKGKGIDIENIPRATLEKGYTTTGTMGHGMKMMLETADRVWLLTGQAGTTVVIEQDKEALKREWI